jgi:hypothetical protein
LSIIMNAAQIIIVADGVWCMVSHKISIMTFWVQKVIQLLLLRSKKAISRQQGSKRTGCVAYSS